jgi:glycosyltransferase involved in cell wall biosynthesis
MQEHLVSIIIPTYNRAYLIAETIESIIAQSYTNWECIIVDDGSSDNTEELIESFSKNDSRIQYYERPVDRIKGANACRNYGFEISKGEYVNWFDSDDVMAFDFLEVAFKEFDKNNNIDFVLFDFEVFKENVSNIIRIQKNKTNNLIEDYATWKINFGTWAIVWKRNFVEDYSFDENLHRAQDLDFNLRIFFNESYDFITSNHIGVYLRQHEKNLTSDFNKMNVNSLISEFKVRKYMIDSLIERKTSEDIVVKSVEIMTIAYRKMYRGNHFKLFFKSINYSINFNRGVFRKLLWYLKFIILFTLLILFKSGDLQMKKHLHKIPFGKI